jgi:hypothetical protein
MTDPTSVHQGLIKSTPTTGRISKQVSTEPGAPSSSLDPSPLARPLWPLLTSHSRWSRDLPRLSGAKRDLLEQKTSTLIARPPDLRDLALVTRASR